MTTPVSTTGDRELDFTGDSVQLVTRKGADILWIHRFEDDDNNALNITNWDFTRSTTPPIAGGGAVRNGVDAQGNPLLVPIDIVKFDADVGSENTYVVQGASYDMATTTLVLLFASGEQPSAVAPNSFFRIRTGVQEFDFASADVTAGSDRWTISITPDAMNPQTTFNQPVASPAYTLEEKTTPFEENAIQCYFPTSLLTNVNPSSGRSNNAPFEIEARINTGRVRSDGSLIQLTQVIAAGIITVYSDVYTAPPTP